MPEECARLKVGSDELDILLTNLKVVSPPHWALALYFGDDGIVSVCGNPGDVDRFTTTSAGVRLRVVREYSQV